MRHHPSSPKAIGRRSQITPPNRFERTSTDADYEQLTAEDLADEERKLPTEFFPDQTRSILAENDSPDIGFRYQFLRRADDNTPLPYNQVLFERPNLEPSTPRCDCLIQLSHLQDY